MSDRLTVADALADGKRSFNWRTQIVRNVLFAVFLIALKLFSVPSTSHTIRVVLVLAIIPLMIGGFFEWGSADKRLDEFQRDVTRDGYSFVFRVMFYVLWFMFLLDTAFTLPLSISMPFGLAPFVIGWSDTAFLSLLVYVVANVVILKRRTRG